ncbi:type III pantothenate kinase [Sunxiuqinia indica]|uniref:type III pantothenate kinase n=1 Tax=Sunxiuqinia indica TaxID=2692584 RepID=UPI001359650C|nr:type III pantothenate kinase [Sunxiuqinia indica]
MRLAIDIGNTNIVFGIRKQENWKNIWRIRTDKLKTADEYEVIFRSLFESGGVEPEKISKVIISSVVPSLNDDFKELISRLLSVVPLFVVPETYSKLPIKILNPYQIGTDLVANAMAAFVKYDKPCMVIDFGTALTFLTLAENGEILGVAIAPGMGTAVTALAGNTSQLPHVQLSMPPSVLGLNTVNAIQAGVVYGYLGLVSRIIEQTEAELNKELHVIATGGLSGIFREEKTKIDHFEANLTLDGLIAIAEYVD